MYKTLLFLYTLSFFQVWNVNCRKTLSCHLAVLPFKDLKCQSEDPYQISAAAVTYLVQRGNSIFQLKVKNLSDQENELYLKHKQEIMQKEHSKSKGHQSELAWNMRPKPPIQKELVSEEDYEQIRKIETDSDPQRKHQKELLINLEVDDLISRERRIELSEIKRQESIAAKNKDPWENLKEQVARETTESQEIENAELVNSPYLVLQIPKRFVVDLNEAQVLMALDESRYFQKLRGEHLFAGFKLLLLDHFANGSLRDFLLRDAQRPEADRFFRTEISKMKFLDKLTEAVIDLHRLGYVHVNLSPDSVYLNSEMDPVIGNFEYAHELGSMSQLDESFFVCEGNFLFTSKAQLKETEHDKAIDWGKIKMDSHAKDAGQPKSVKFKRSLEYLAPELVIPESDRSFYFNDKLDTYSLGAIYYFMLYGKAPFEANSRQQLIEKLSSRYIVLYAGTSNNSVSIFGNSLNLVPDGRISTYYLGLLITRELSRNFEGKLAQDVNVSTDFEYTNKYGRDFFDKYSEMIFVLFMAFIIIPLTVFLASYKFKADNQQEQAPAQAENNPPINMEQIVNNPRM